MPTAVFGPGSSASAWSAPDPSHAEYWHIPVQPPLGIPVWDISSAVATYNFAGFGTGGDTAEVTVTGPYGSGNASVVIPGVGAGQPWAVVVSVTWSAVGRTWIKYHEGELNASPGNTSVSVSGASSWSGVQFELTVTYTESGCTTCQLCFEVSDGCDGSAVGGVTVTVTPAGSGTTSGGGEVCFTVYSGVYTWTVEKLGYTTQTGTYTCDCGGGSATISISFEPTGGCDSCDLTITVIDYCTGLPLSGVTITVDGTNTCVTDGTGICVFTGLANGDHTVVISRTGYASQTRTYRCTG